MPGIKQQGQIDGGMWPQAEREVSGAFEEPIYIKRWTSAAGGDPADGVAETDTFLMIRTMGNVTELSAQETFLPGSIYVAGDLRAEIRIQVFGGEAGDGDNLTPGRRPDRAVYRNREYKFVGHVDRKKMTDRWYWVGVLRQAGSS